MGEEEQNNPLYEETVIIKQTTQMEKQFNRLREKDLFIDCKFNDGTHPEIKAHRIILARYSNVFRNLFTEENNRKLPEESDYAIPYCTDFDSFKACIDFMYTNEINVSSKNIMKIFLTAYILGIFELASLINDFLYKTMDSELVLEYTSDLVTYDVVKHDLENKTFTRYPAIKQNYLELCSMSEKFSQFVVEHNKVKDKENDKQKEEGPKILQRKDKIIRSIPPYMVSSVLKPVTLSPDENEQIYTTQEDLKLNLIDKYVAIFEKDHRQIIDLDREFLSTIIDDWDQGDEYLYMVNHKCDWVKPSIARSICRKIMENRRKSVHSFQEIVDKLQGNDHHALGVMPLLQLVASSKGETEVPYTNVFETLSTMSNTINMINPLKYGFVRLTPNTSKPMTPSFAPENMFVNDNETYYMALSCYAEELGPLDPPPSELRAGFTFDYTRDGKYVKANLELKDTNSIRPIHMSKENDEAANTLDFENRFDPEHSQMEVICRSKDSHLKIFTLRLSFIEVIGRFILK